MREEE